MNPAQDEAIRDLWRVVTIELIRTTARTPAGRTVLLNLLHSDESLAVRGLAFAALIDADSLAPHGIG